jgi:hypothetical protein
VNPTQVRSEGVTELLGDIVITCQGGNQITQGSLVPTANIVVALGSTSVTSRVIANGLSEALLLIDEPGSATATGPGVLLPQTLCSGGVLGAGPGGCVTYANVAASSAVAQQCTTVTGGICTGFGTGAVPNVFQGVVVAPNQVVFNGIPILAPVSAGQARVFRITNVRANASQLAGTAGQFQGVIPIQASVTISNLAPVANPVVSPAFLFNGLGTTVIRNAANSSTASSTTGASTLSLCATAGLTAGAVLRFPEGFGSAFKTRVAPTTAYSGAGTVGGGASTAALTGYSQNIPGQLAIAGSSESGFIFNGASSSSSVAGLADFGTRLKATFTNIPAGVTLYVSTTNINPVGNINNPANTATNGSFFNTSAIPTGPAVAPNTLLAGLVLSETATAPAGGFLPLTPSTNNSSGAILAALTPDANGTASAVWEILSANPAASENAEFALFYSQNATTTAALTAAPPAVNVTMSFAPTTAATTSLIPRFVAPQTSNPVLSFGLCVTTLLYPFVTASGGLDTGIAIANTSSDPFSTRTQAGTCQLNFYGSNPGTTTSATTPSVPAGQVYADNISSLRPNFTGYIIAVCNFPLAHGYALVSDIGIRNWATSYLALVLPTGTSSRNSGSLTGSIGTATIEGIGH